MLKLLLVTSLFFALGQQQQNFERSYNNLKEREFESLHRLLSGAVLERVTLDTPSGLRKLPCSSRRSEISGRRQLDELQIPLNPSLDQNKYEQLGSIPETQVDDETNDESRNMLYESKSKKMDCRVQLNKNKNNSDDVQHDKIESMLGKENAKKNSLVNDDLEKIRFTTTETSALKNTKTAKIVDVPPVRLCGTTTEAPSDSDLESRRSLSEPPVKFCGTSTTENSISLDTRRFLSDGIPVNIPSAIENQNRYEHNMNLRSDIIRNQLLSSIFNKGPVNKFGNDMADDIYSDYPVNTLSMNQNLQSSNIQRPEIPAHKKTKFVKNHDLIEGTEKKNYKDYNSNENKAVSSNRNDIDNDAYDVNRSSGRVDGKMSTMEDQLIEPTRGSGIADMSQTRVSLMDNPRVCYACSSTSDISCWRPNRRTTVKYCNKNHNACVTNTYKSHDQGFIVIRDCGETCDVTIPYLDAKYSSCSLCKSDLCNNHSVERNASVSYSSESVLFLLIVIGCSKILLL